MAERGGQPGNDNAKKSNRVWQEAIKRVVAQGDSQKLRDLAEKLVSLAEAGDVAALKELGDRLDGKPAQQVQVSGDSDSPLVVSVVKFLDAADKPTE